MEFDWDEEKAARNLKEHGVSFQTATTAFNDRCAIEFLDDREDYGEEPVILIGHDAFGTLLFVVYTLREELHRLISARRATKNEQNEYYLQNA
jgi:uncharacterized protein